METKYLEWIGTGAGLNPALGNTSFMVKGDNRTLLVDCGFTVSLELIKQNKLRDITDVVLTHVHADHIGGVEGLAFMNYFAYRKRGDERPNLYLPNREFAIDLWENSLKGGLEKIQDENNRPIKATLETYFKVNITKEIEIPYIPKVNLFTAKHVPTMDCHGLYFENGIYYSGDNLDLPRQDAKLIFQDCQFFESPTDVHISYKRLNRELPREVKSRTYLVHLGMGWEKLNPKEDGFAGFVMPGDKFSLENLGVKL